MQPLVRAIHVASRVAAGASRQLAELQDDPPRQVIEIDVVEILRYARVGDGYRHRIGDEPGNPGLSAEIGIEGGFPDRRAARCREQRCDAESAEPRADPGYRSHQKPACKDT